MSAVNGIIKMILYTCSCLEELESLQKEEALRKKFDRETNGAEKNKGQDSQTTKPSLENETINLID